MRLFLFEEQNRFHFLSIQMLHVDDFGGGKNLYLCEVKLQSEKVFLYPLLFFMSLFLLM